MKRVIYHLVIILLLLASAAVAGEVQDFATAVQNSFKMYGRPEIVVETYSRLIFKFKKSEDEFARLDLNKLTGEAKSTLEPRYETNNESNVSNPQ